MPLRKSILWRCGSFFFLLNVVQLSECGTCGYFCNAFYRSRSFDNLGTGIADDVELFVERKRGRQRHARSSLLILRRPMAAPALCDVAFSRNQLKINDLFYYEKPLNFYTAFSLGYGSSRRRAPPFARRWGARCCQVWHEQPPPTPIYRDSKNRVEKSKFRNGEKKVRLSHSKPHNFHGNQR